MWRGGDEGEIDKNEGAVASEALETWLNTAPNRMKRRKEPHGSFFYAHVEKKGVNVWPNVAIDAIDGWEIEKDG